MLQCDFALNAFSDGALGCTNFTERERLGNWDDECAIGGRLEHRIQRVNIGAMPEFVNGHTVIGIDPLGNLDDAGNLPTVAHIFDEISHDGRYGANGEIESSLNRWFGDIDCFTS